MSTWDVALVREQGTEFGVVVVDDNIIESPRQREEVLRWWTIHLGKPVVLMGAHRHRTFGRPDIVRWLASVDPARLPWRRMTIAA